MSSGTVPIKGRYNVALTNGETSKKLASVPSLGKLIDTPRLLKLLVSSFPCTPLSAYVIIIFLVVPERESTEKGIQRQDTIASKGLLNEFFIPSQIPSKKLLAVMVAEKAASCDCVIAYTAQAPL